MEKKATPRQKLAIVGLAVVIVILLALTVTERAESGWCPIKPLTPMNCEPSSARCQCDSSGACYWVWTRCRR